MMQNILAAARRLGLAIGLTAVALAAAAPPALAQGKVIVVEAAASLKNALDDADAGFAAAGMGKATAVYGASSTLAKQIENGAPSDVFISADEDWMNYLAGKQLIKADTRSDLLGNAIVLVAPADSKVSTEIKPGFPLAQLLAGGKLAMADPASVPAGKYGRAALEELGVWASVADKVAAAENVRAALLLVERGEAPLGIVYRTDAAADKGVKIVASFPEDTHPRIIYPIAVTAQAKDPATAAAYLAFLRSDKAKAAFEKQGFTVLR